MKVKKSLLLIVPMLLTGCANAVTSSETNNTNNEISSSSSEQKSSSNEFSSLNNSSIQIETPYSFELNAFEIPSEMQGEYSYLGNTMDITECTPFTVASDAYCLNIFNRDFIKEVNEPCELAYCSIDHKPIITPRTYLFDELDELGNSFDDLGMNVSIPASHFKGKAKYYIESNKKYNRTALLYYAGATASYYKQTLGELDSRKKNFTSNIDLSFTLSVSKACSSGNLNDVLSIFNEFGTHVMWSCEYGVEYWCRYLAKSSRYDLTEYNTPEIKNAFDSALLAGIESKTIEEYKEKINFCLRDYIGTNDYTSFDEDIDEHHAIGPTSIFLSSNTEGLPKEGMFGMAAARVTKLALNEEDMRDVTCLKATEIYPIWEFLPADMASEALVLELAYPKYLEFKEKCDMGEASIWDL